MKKSNDGFVISEEDLKIRGCGELFGFKQHGDIGFILSDMSEDMSTFKIAYEEAKKFLQSSDESDISIKNEIVKNIEKSSKFICFN